MSLYNILMAINNVISWDPCEIFYETHVEWRSYDKPYTVFGCSMHGTIDTTHTYTKLGQWFEDAPFVCQLIKLPYYIATWPIWLLLKLLWVIIGMFFPKKYNKCFD